MSDEYKVRIQSKYTWKIEVGNTHSSIAFNMIGTPPNKFHRLMYKILLGWRVEKI